MVVVALSLVQGMCIQNAFIRFNVRISQAEMGQSEKKTLSLIIISVRH